MVKYAKMETLIDFVAKKSEKASFYRYDCILKKIEKSMNQFNVFIPLSDHWLLAAEPVILFNYATFAFDDETNSSAHKVIRQK